MKIVRIIGKAGSGKTHLLELVASELAVYTTVLPQYQFLQEMYGMSNPQHFLDFLSHKDSGVTVLFDNATEEGLTALKEYIGEHLPGKSVFVYAAMES